MLQVNGQLIFDITAHIGTTDICSYNLCHSVAQTICEAIAKDFQSVDDNDVISLSCAPYKITKDAEDDMLYNYGTWMIQFNLEQFSLTLLDFESYIQSLLAKYHSSCTLYLFDYVYRCRSVTGLGYGKVYTPSMSWVTIDDVSLAFIREKLSTMDSTVIQNLQQRYSNVITDSGSWCIDYTHMTEQEWINLCLAIHRYSE